MPSEQRFRSGHHRHSRPVELDDLTDAHVITTRVVDTKILNLDPDPEFWSNLNSDSAFWPNMNPDLDPGLLTNRQTLG